MTPIVKVRE